VVDRLGSDCPTTGPIHHEVHLLADGRVMYLSKTVPRPGFGDPPASQQGDIIGIWDQKTRANEIVWNIFDHLSPRDHTDPASDTTVLEEVDLGGCVLAADVQDWSHANSAYMAEDGSVLVSFRHLNQVVSIAPDFQSVRWRLGGPGSDFTFPDAEDRFYH